MHASGRFDWHGFFQTLNVHNDIYRARWSVDNIYIIQINDGKWDLQNFYYYLTIYNDWAVQLLTTTAEGNDLTDIQIYKYIDDVIF